MQCSKWLISLQLLIPVKRTVLSLFRLKDWTMRTVPRQVPQKLTTTRLRAVMGLLLMRFVFRRPLKMPNVTCGDMVFIMLMDQGMS